MKILLLVVALAGLAGSARAAQETVLRLDFGGDAPLEELRGTAGRIVSGYDGSPSLLIEKAEPEGSAVRRVPVPIECIAGRTITWSAMVRAEDVTEKPRHYNGIKVMLVLEFDGGGRQYPQIDLPVGTFDWTRHERWLRVPAKARKATLVLGLESVGGRVWFDDVEILVGRPARTGRRSDTMFRGHDLPRLRGVMHGPRTNEENVRVLAREWGANHVRWQINWTPMKEAEKWAADLDAFDEWFESILPEVDRAMDWAEEQGLIVLLDLHTPPGGRVEGGVCPLFTRPDAQDKMVEIWQRLARRYKGRDHIYAYDLLNEPVEPPPGPGVVTWPELFARVTRAIREIDPGKPVLFEPGPWGGCGGFDRIGALDLDRVIYGFHMYQPHQFTHQGVHGSPTGVSYPGEVAGLHWDKEQLREAMRPAVDFQQEFNVHMHVGEFSAIRWAPDGSAYRYLRDCIELFEEYGWDWSYHAYREWPGWSVEHGPDPDDWDPTPEPTERKELLLDWFAKNERPGP